MERARNTIRNPVMGAPWAGRRAALQPPTGLTCALERRRQRQRRKASHPKQLAWRHYYVEVLALRYPALKKCEALAALTLARYDFHQATQIAEAFLSRDPKIDEYYANLSNCYHYFSYYQGVASDGRAPPVLQADAGCTPAVSVAAASCDSGISSERGEEAAQYQFKGTDRIGVTIVRTDKGYESSLL